MTGRTHFFDLDEFAAHLDETRTRRRMTWRAVARATGVTSSTLTRLTHGYGADIHTIASLAAWAGLELGWFVGTSDPDGAP